MSLKALGYVEPRAAPGRDIAQFGMEKGLEFLKKLGQASRTGDIRDIAALGSAQSYDIEEAVADGMAIAGALECRSPSFVEVLSHVEQLMSARSGREMIDNDMLRFSALMSPQYRQRRGLPDPVVELRNRRIREASGRARALCTAKYDPPAFCDCVVGDLRKQELDETAWSEIGQDFSKIVPLAVRQASVAEVVRACIRRS